jgi:hypothetical protein
MGKILSQFNGVVFHDPYLDTFGQYTEKNNLLPVGFSVHNDKTNLVKSAWNKGYPLMAVPFWWMDKYNGYKYVNPFLGSLAVVLVYLIAVRMGYPEGGLIASLLLGTSWLQIWHSRYPLSEITSQVFFLISLYFIVVYVQKYKISCLILTSLAISFAVFTHFGNILLAIGYTIGMTIFAFIKFKKEQVLTYKLVLDEFYILLFLFLIPVLVFFLNFKLDPGIQQYGSQAGSFSGYNLFFKLSGDVPFLNALNLKLLERVSNFCVLVSVPLLFLGVIGWYDLIMNDSKNRFIWISLSLIIIGCSIIYMSRINPWVLYAARRNVPIILPCLYLFVGAFLALRYRTFLAHHKKRYEVILTKISLVVLSAFLFTAQVLSYLPYNHINKGKGLPQMCLHTRNTLEKYAPLSNSLVILTDPSSGLFQAGLRYIYDVPIMTSGSLDEQVKVIERCLKDGCHMYLLGTADSNVTNSLLSIFNTRAVELWSMSITFFDPNYTGIFNWPSKGSGVLTYHLIKINPAESLKL